MYSFFAMMARMKNIERWALMRNSIQENISEHSLEVAMLAHGLSLIANEKCGKHVDSNEIALMGMYHDANEIITGDMPTPVKYYDDDIKVPMALTAIMDLFYNLAVYGLQFFLRGRLGLFTYLYRIIIPEIFYTVFLTMIVYKIFYYINHRFMSATRKERESIWVLK